MSTAVTLVREADPTSDEGFAAVRSAPTLAGAMAFLAQLPGRPGLERLADPDRPIRTLVVDAADPDLLVYTHQHVLVTRIHDVRSGIRVLKQLTGIEEVIILARSEVIQGHGGARRAHPDRRPPLPVRPARPRHGAPLRPDRPGRADPGGSRVCFMSAEAVASIGEAFDTGRVPTLKTLTVTPRDGRPAWSRSRSARRSAASSRISA